MIQTTHSPHLGKFDNPITGGILLLVLSLIIGGFIFALRGTWFSVLTGLVLASIGATIWVLGETEHKTDKPREAGVLTFWGTPISLPWFEKWEDTIVVGGKVILANYPPCYVDSIKIDIENKDRTFSFTVMTKDKFPLPVKLHITTRVDLEDVLDYIQAGNDMNLVFEQFDSIASRDTATICKEWKIEDLYWNREKVSQEMEKKVYDIFETASFGVQVTKANFEPEFPTDVVEKLRKIRYEGWERETELQDYSTMQEAGLILQRKLVRELMPPRDPKLDPPTDAELDEEIKKRVAAKAIPDLAACIEIIKSQRLVQDGKVARVESNSGAGVVVSNVTIDLGGKKTK